MAAPRSFFDLDDSYGTPFSDFYRCSYDTTPCIEYVTPERLRNGPGLPAFEIDSFGQGCGSHFAPHQDPAYRDCGGGWSIYMRQSFPGYANRARAIDGSPMKNWWPFLFY